MLLEWFEVSSIDTSSFPDALDEGESIEGSLTNDDSFFRLATEYSEFAEESSLESSKLFPFIVLQCNW